MKKIGMVVALQAEIIPFLEASDVEIKKNSVYNFTVAEFKLGENEVVCVNSGIGEIMGAAATQYLITAYKPDLIINFGVCGSLSDELGLKSVAIVDGVIPYDFDTSAIDGTKVGQYDGYPDVVIPADKDMILSAKKFLPDVQTVLCASADKFVAAEDIKENLKRSFGASVCDMESAGVLITAKSAEKPCLIIKAVSDGKGGVEDYCATIHEAARQYIDFLIKFVKSL